MALVAMLHRPPAEVRVRMKPETLAGLLYRATALLTSLPWPWLRALGDALAWGWTAIDARESRVARRNLELAYPELLPAQRQELHRHNPAHDRPAGVGNLAFLDPATRREPGSSA